MKLTRINITNYLEMNGHNVDDMKWNDLLSLYKKVKEENKTTITKDEMIKEVDKSLVEQFDNEYDNKEVRKESISKKYDIKNQLIIKILDLMERIKGKTRGTPEEVKEMFNLYNNFYKRNESPGCSQCVGNVYNKLLKIYKKYK